MAYTLLPPVNINEPTKTSWANQVRSNQEDHESRIIQNRTDIDILNSGDLLDFWTYSKGAHFTANSGIDVIFNAAVPTNVPLISIDGLYVGSDHSGNNEVAIGRCMIYLDMVNSRIKGIGTLSGQMPFGAGNQEHFRHDDWTSWNGSRLSIMGGMLDGPNYCQVYVQKSGSVLTFSMYHYSRGGDRYSGASIHLKQIK